MAQLMLYGNGWTQRWRIADGGEDRIRNEVTRVGSDGAGHLSVIDPRTDEPAMLVVSWAAVAAAVVLESSAEHDEAPGQYA
jgi:hypothetical protein